MLLNQGNFLAISVFAWYNISSFLPVEHIGW